MRGYELHISSIESIGSDIRTIESKHVFLDVCKNIGLAVHCKKNLLLVLLYGCETRSLTVDSNTI